MWSTRWTPCHPDPDAALPRAVHAGRSGRGTGDLPGTMPTPPASAAPAGGSDGGTSSSARLAVAERRRREFSFTLPCGWRRSRARHRLQGGHYDSPSLSLMYDYGRYSSNLGELQGQPELREESSTIGGKPARIVTYAAPRRQRAPFTAAVAFASVGPASAPTRSVSPWWRTARRLPTGDREADLPIDPVQVAVAPVCLALAQSISTSHGPLPEGRTMPGTRSS